MWWCVGVGPYVDCVVKCTFLIKLKCLPSEVTKNTSCNIVAEHILPLSGGCCIYVTLCSFSVALCDLSRVWPCPRPMTADGGSSWPLQTHSIVVTNSSLHCKGWGWDMLVCVFCSISMMRCLAHYKDGPVMQMIHHLVHALNALCICVRNNSSLLNWSGDATDALFSISWCTSKQFYYFYISYLNWIHFSWNSWIKKIWTYLSWYGYINAYKYWIKCFFTS